VTGTPIIHIDLDAVDKRLNGADRLLARAFGVAP
jgi:hypothetical protein